MSFSNTMENAILSLLLLNANIANLGDATGVRGSTAAGSLYWGLHTADPGEAGDQTTSEVAYTGYARVAAARSAAGFAVSGNVANPFANADFGQCTAAGTTALFWSLGLAASGAGSILFRGILGSARLGGFYGATSDTITIPGLAGLAVDDRIYFRGAPGLTLPAGLAEGTIYWVRTVTGTGITVAVTQGGAAIDITAEGVGIAYRATPMAINVGSIPRLTTALAVTLD